MKIEYPDPKRPDMTPEAIEQRLQMVEALRKLGMSLKDAGEQTRQKEMNNNVIPDADLRHSATMR